MSESQGRDLKPPEDGMFYENFGFGTFFWYHNFQNEIDAWESTVQGVFCPDHCRKELSCSYLSWREVKYKFLGENSTLTLLQLKNNLK